MKRKALKEKQAIPLFLQRWAERAPWSPFPGVCLVQRQSVEVDVSQECRPCEIRGECGEVGWAAELWPAPSKKLLLPAPYVAWNVSRRWREGEDGRASRCVWAGVVRCSREAVHESGNAMVPPCQGAGQRCDGDGRGRKKKRCEEYGKKGDSVC